MGKGLTGILFYVCKMQVLAKRAMVKYDQKKKVINIKDILYLIYFINQKIYN